MFYREKKKNGTFELETTDLHVEISRKESRKTRNTERAKPGDSFDFVFFDTNNNPREGGSKSSDIISKNY